MELHTEVLDGVAVVTMPGPSLDAGNCKAAKAALEALVEKTPRLVLALQELQFIDSAGLSVLLALSRRVELRLCGVTAPVLTILEMVRMQRLIKIYPDLPKALE